MLGLHHGSNTDSPRLTPDTSPTGLSLLECAPSNLIRVRDERCSPCLKLTGTSGVATSSVHHDISHGGDRQEARLAESFKVAPAVK